MLPRSFILAVSPFVAALACASARYSTEPGAPTLVLPGRLAEGKGGPSARPGVSPAPVASSSAAPSGPGSAPSGAPLVASTSPDPTPLRMAEQVEYQLELSEGKVHVLSVKPVKLQEPIVTPRRLGRYAIELSIGHELIERLRFDFPGTAADEPQVGPKKLLFSPLTLSARAIAHVTLTLPQSPRVRRALLVDRGTNAVTELDWPLPSVPKSAPPALSAPPSAAAPPSPRAPSSAAAPPSPRAPSSAAAPPSPAASSGAAAPRSPVAPSSAAAAPSAPAPSPAAAPRR